MRLQAFKMRALLSLLAATGLLLGSFALWGDYFEGLFHPGTPATQPGPGAAGFTILLLSLDVFLPIPVTIVLTTQGSAYGPWTGGLIGLAGTTSAGTLAYLICRLGNQRAARFLLGEKALRPIQQLFQRHGGWAVALSRWMAIVPEIVSCGAGLVRMPARHYFPALLCGTLPMSFTYAWLGSTQQMAKHPLAGMLLSAFVPLLLWAIVSIWLKKRTSAD